MALEEIIEYDKIEVVGEHKIVQVRKATVVKKDGNEIARSFERYSLEPGTLDGDNNLIDNPLLKEPDGVTDMPEEVKGICTSVWTPVIKNAWREKLISVNSSTPIM